MKGNKGERRKYEWEISERETEHERLLTLGNELGVGEGEVGGGGSDWSSDVCSSDLNKFIFYWCSICQHTE